MALLVELAWIEEPASDDPDPERVRRRTHVAPFAVADEHAALVAVVASAFP
jgi:hypothetical protein